MSALLQLPLDARPREKLFRLGEAALTEEELWCCVLGLGSRRASVTTLAHRINQKFLTSDSPTFHDLALGSAQLARVTAVQELFSRYKKQAHMVLRTPEDALAYCRDLCSASREHIRALYCSARAEVVHAETLALGGVNVCYLQPKDIFYPLRLQPVDSIILVHNHPSGSLEPSPDDIVFTKRIEAACQLMGLFLRDHVIVGKTGCVSLRRMGIIPTLDQEAALPEEKQNSPLRG